MQILDDDKINALSHAHAHAKTAHTMAMQLKLHDGRVQAS